jgi:hypothetical protein
LQVLGELAPDTSAAERRVAAFSLFGMMNWIYNWYNPERDVPVAELANQMSQLFLQGFLAAADVSTRTAATSGTFQSIWKT